jgi:Bacterial TniB protein
MQIFDYRPYRCGNCALRAASWRSAAIRCARMPCLLLYGESGMGKTMIVEKFERMHPPRHDRKSGIESRPVMIIQFPSGPDERRLFVRILHGLGAPYSAYWRIDALERAAMNALALVHVQSAIASRGGCTPVSGSRTLSGASRAL